MIHTCLPIAAARCAIAVSIVTTASRLSMIAAQPLADEEVLKPLGQLLRVFGLIVLASQDTSLALAFLECGEPRRPRIVRVLVTLPPWPNPTPYAMPLTVPLAAMEPPAVFVR